MRVFVAIVAVTQFMSCWAAGDARRSALAASLDRPYYGEASDAAKAVGIDYRALMHRAVAKDPVALRKLVQLCADPHFDGAGLEVHCQYLRDLLTLWGDEPFARALSSATSKERHVLQWAFSGDKSFSRSHPATGRLVYRHL
jgi:hypothetical protein